AEVRGETADTISVRFDVPNELREAYRFTQGQFLTLRVPPGQLPGHEELRRSYSICCAVQDYDAHGELRVSANAFGWFGSGNLLYRTLVMAPVREVL
ncbi:hypothetical protein J8J20_21335, partial [Mycobacterium tuberculosis]|nr:hypothetical protein [Mycobacterium tuberculosis]